MKRFIAYLLIVFFLFPASIFALEINDQAKHDAKTICLVTRLYQEFFEKKNFDDMQEYFSDAVKLHKDFDGPGDYHMLYKHLVEQGQECVKLKMLPFDKIIVSGNEATTFYTQSCTDKLNHIQKKRIMAITEFDASHKVLNIWVVTHEDK